MSGACLSFCLPACLPGPKWASITSSGTQLWGAVRAPESGPAFWVRLYLHRIKVFSISHRPIHWVDVKSRVLDELTVANWRVFPGVFQDDICIAISAYESADYNTTIGNDNPEHSAQPRSQLCSGVRHRLWGMLVFAIYHNLGYVSCEIVYLLLALSLASLYRLGLRWLPLVQIALLLSSTERSVYLMIK